MIVDWTVVGTVDATVRIPEPAGGVEVDVTVVLEISVARIGCMPIARVGVSVTVIVAKAVAVVVAVVERTESVDI